MNNRNTLWVNLPASVLVIMCTTSLVESTSRTVRSILRKRGSVRASLDPAGSGNKRWSFCSGHSWQGGGKQYSIYKAFSQGRLVLTLSITFNLSLEEKRGLWTTLMLNTMMVLPCWYSCECWVIQIIQNNRSTWSCWFSMCLAFKSCLILTAIQMVFLWPLSQSLILKLQESAMITLITLVWCPCPPPWDGWPDKTLFPVTSSRA